MYTYNNKEYKTNKIKVLIITLVLLLVMGFILNDYLLGKLISLEGSVLTKDTTYKKGPVDRKKLTPGIHYVISIQAKNGLRRVIVIDPNDWEHIEKGDYVKAKLILTRDASTINDLESQRLLRLEAFRKNTKVINSFYNFLPEILIVLPFSIFILLYITDSFLKVNTTGIVEEKTTEFHEKQMIQIVKVNQTIQIVKVNGQTFSSDENLDEIQTGDYVFVEYTPILKTIITLTKKNP